MGRIIGYAPGVYDLFHVGHLNVLQHARTQCDVLVAGVVSDEMCELAKGVRPFIPFRERIEIVRHVDVVDAVHPETVPGKITAWEEVGFHRIFKGDDWRGTPKGDQLEADMARCGVEVCYFPYTVHTSSTELRRALEVLGGGRHREAAGE